jgi:hypothetical protein
MTMAETEVRAARAAREQARALARPLRLACLLCRLLALACVLVCVGGIAAGGDATPLLTVAVLAAIVGAGVTGNSARLRGGDTKHRPPGSV